MIDNAQAFAADIARHRREHVADAVRYALAAGLAGDEVERLAVLAGWEWDDTHPTYRLGVA